MAIPQSNSTVTYGAAMAALAGETTLGDRYVVKHHPGGILVTVIDGLGHGAEAARAADIAVRVVETTESSNLEELLTRCHGALRDSRGVAMTIVSLSPASGTVSSIAVGNVQGMIARASSPEPYAERDFVVLRGGVVGHILPPLRVAVTPLRHGDTLVLATDGVGIEFTTEEKLEGPPQTIAERLLSRYSLETDDALVLVVRYTGP